MNLISVKNATGINIYASHSCPCPHRALVWKLTVATVSPPMHMPPDARKFGDRHIDSPLALHHTPHSRKERPDCLESRRPGSTIKSVVTCHDNALIYNAVKNLGELSTLSQRILNLLMKGHKEKKNSIKLSRVPRKHASKAKVFHWKNRSRIWSSWDGIYSCCRGVESVTIFGGAHTTIPRQLKKKWKDFYIFLVKSEGVVQTKECLKRISKLRTGEHGEESWQGNMRNIAPIFYRISTFYVVLW